MDGDVATARTRAAVSSPRLVNVSGTANAPLAYRLRNVARRSKKKPKMPPDNRYEAIVEAIEDDKRFALLTQDERRHKRKLISINVQKIVDQGMEAYEEDLEVRRDNLRRLLLIEEADLTRELIQMVKDLEEKREMKLAAKAAEAEKEREFARQELLHEKQLQQFVLMNPKLREVRNRMRTEDTKRANVAQMADNEERRRLECERIAYWDQLMLDRNNAELTADAKSAKMRANHKRNLVKELREQMEAKSRYRPPEDLIDENVRILPMRDPLVEQQIKREKNRKLREDLEKQILESKRALEMRENEEKSLNEMTSALSIRPDISDIEQQQNREIRRREIFAYMENLRGFREVLAEREAKADEYAHRWVKEMNEKKSEAQRLAKEKKRRADHELKHAWDQQLENKRSLQQSELDPGNRGHPQLHLLC
ncbi:PREDICTED: arginine and glutamate-rich protein 1 [Ceratosolen solmsi marchali]|uniref:Arginine and glutamate-rich protein 1 n=1 Tax=Ceratosolen solmsi marchali TaxID=326594 RepID=A0AAJ6YGL7_9HYME|nr:PREDICTED: arginine and glutamate-rich protein 1 [Ceratosolen solmsi marchali]